MSPEEKASLSALQAEILEEKLRAYELLRHLVADPDGLRPSGYRDLGHACETIVSTTARKIEKLVRAHEKKFP